MDSRAFWHAEVGDDDIELAFGDLLVRTLDGVDGRADVPGTTQGIDDHIRVLNLVFDDEYLSDNGFVFGVLFSHS